MGRLSNNRHYDQYIMKGILLRMNPKRINDWIIVEKKGRVAIFISVQQSSND